jgi:hypothetical protein
MAEKLHGNGHSTAAKQSHGLMAMGLSSSGDRLIIAKWCKTRDFNCYFNSVSLSSWIIFWQTSTFHPLHHQTTSPRYDSWEVAEGNLVIFHHVLYENLTWLRKIAVSCREILVFSLAESEEIGTGAAVISPFLPWL